MQDLLTPQNCALVLLDQQAGLQFGVQSMERQTLLNNSVALMETALAFALPMVISTSASKVYSGPLLPDLRAGPGHPVLERRNMNAWKTTPCAPPSKPPAARNSSSRHADRSVHQLAALSALEAGYECYVVGDACGGLTLAGHELALQRMTAKGAQPTSWLQVPGIAARLDPPRHLRCGARSLKRMAGATASACATRARCCRRINQRP
jgi:hypothetical protein